MEEEILRNLSLVQDACGMYEAAASGLVQRLIGESAQRFQAKVERGEQTVVGVNAYRVDETASDRPPVQTVDDDAMRAHLAAFATWKAARSQAAVATALDDLARAVNAPHANAFEGVIAAAEAGCTHGEICAVLRRELGFGHVQAIV
jgi:methylmalonyl-CoA mutase N-terminal domain/subunit